MYTFVPNLGPRQRLLQEVRETAPCEGALPVEELPDLVAPLAGNVGVLQVVGVRPLALELSARGYAPRNLLLILLVHRAGATTGLSSPFANDTQNCPNTPTG